jgi:hypothetical protein
MKFGFQNGLSLRQSLQIYLNKDLNSEWRSLVHSWLRSIELNGQVPTFEQFDHLTRITFETLAKGMSHQPIVETLDQLEEEIVIRDQIYLQRQIAILPIKSLIPLLLLQVPALMILVFVPLLNKLSF